MSYQFDEKAFLGNPLKKFQRHEAYVGYTPHKAAKA